MDFLDALTSASMKPKTYVDDVFSAFTYTGNGAARTISNGIDLAGKGGLVWIKQRSGTQDHVLFDTSRGVNNYLRTNSAAVQNSSYSDLLTAFGASGFNLGADASTAGLVNGSGSTYGSLTFREAEKFFDVVTYSGNGVNRTIPHALGQAPGMILIKDINSTSGWFIYHRSLANTQYLRLDNSFAAPIVDSSFWNSTTATSGVFSLGTNGQVNAGGVNYVALLFGHDTDADGLIQSGTFTTNGSSQATVTLGWEPQFVMIRDLAAQQYTTIWDASRGLGADGGQSLFPGVSSAESTNNVVKATATGFTVNQYPSTQYVYTAIRRPNKPPTTGAQVFSAIARTGTGAAAAVTGAGFAPDLVWPMPRGSALGGGIFDRLRGKGKRLPTYGTGAEVDYSDSLSSFDMDGFAVGVDASYLRINQSGTTFINWLLRRAPGVFDEVCYTTPTQVPTAITHNLQVTPELIVVRCRTDGSQDWHVKTLAPIGNGRLNTTAAFALNTIGSITAESATSFTVNNNNQLNLAGASYVAWLFATSPGISKVGSYTGNGSSQTIACGFTTGARFILIKRTDSTGDWFVWDTVRGVIAGNDPHLSLNTASAEVTGDDTIDPDTSGFIVNQLAATNVNVNAATYIFLAIA